MNFSKAKLKSKYIYVFLSVFSGVLQGLSLAWPWTTWGWLGDLGLEKGSSAWWLEWISLSILALLLLKLRAEKNVLVVAGLVWLFSTAWLTSAFGWIYVSLHTFGGLPSWLSFASVLLLGLLLGLYYVLATVIWIKTKARQPCLQILSFGSCWLLGEWLRSTAFSGFGWGGIGYAHLKGPLSVFIPWIGVFGVAGLSACSAMAAAFIFSKDDKEKENASWFLIGLILISGALTLSSMKWTKKNGVLSVSLLQGNIAQDEKFNQQTGIVKAFSWYQNELMMNKSDLIVTPETALPLLPELWPQGYMDKLQKHFDIVQQAALIGMPMGGANEGFTNSVLGIKAGQREAWKYDKHHLVPFGEFTPGFLKWFTKMMEMPLSDFKPGPRIQKLFNILEERVMVHICFENLFTQELGRYFVNEKNAPTILVNISNLAWFGTGTAMDQHLNITKMRALEFERPFLLSTNSGITAIVNQDGEVTQSIARDLPGVLVGSVQGRTGLTPYAYWVSHWNLYPLVLLSTLFIFISGFTRRNRSKTIVSF